MTYIEKFHTDLIRCIKFARQENGGKPNAKKACKDAVSLFLRSTTVPGALPSSLAEYWERTYIDESDNPAEEPSEKNVDRLCALLAFLEGYDEFEDVLTDEDYHMLGELVNYEAEDLPIEKLEYMMGLVVSKGAL